MENPFTEKVKAGAAYLDREVPGWEKKINLATFDIGSSSNCVLGQVLGGYYDYLNPIYFKYPDLFLLETRHDFGFTISLCNSNRYSQALKDLQEAWISEFKSRGIQ